MQGVHHLDILPHPETLQPLKRKRTGRGPHPHLLTIPLHLHFLTLGSQGSCWVFSQLPRSLG
jgi:hypothetical protein